MRSTTSAGFVTGWVLFLDYLIVIALSALFVPHYVGGALERGDLRESPWDAVIAVCSVIALIGGCRVVRRTRLHAAGAGRRAARSRRAGGASCSSASRSCCRPSTLVDGLDLDPADRTWADARLSPSHSDASPTPASRRSRTSRRRRREPGRTLPRSLFSAIGLVVARDRARRAWSVVTAYPGPTERPSSVGQRPRGCRSSGSPPRSTAELPASSSTRSGSQWESRRRLILVGATRPRCRG